MCADVQFCSLRVKHQRVIVRMLEKNLTSLLASLEATACARSEADAEAEKRVDSSTDRLFEDTEVIVCEERKEEFKKWLISTISNDMLSNTLVERGSEAVSKIAAEIGFSEHFVVTAKETEPINELQPMLVVKEQDLSSEEESDEASDDEGEEEEESEEEQGESDEESEEEDAEALEAEAASAGIKGKKLKRIREEITNEEEE